MKHSRLKTKEQKKAKKKETKKAIRVSVTPKALTDKAYNALKWIAIITMFIDHLAVLLSSLQCIDDTTYYAMRTIGRTAFPLYAFLLVECYHHTENKKRHLLRLLFLALISEIPFNILVSHSMLDPYNQNVCITLSLGFLMLWVMDFPIEKLLLKIRPKTKPDGKFVKVYRFIYRANVGAVFCLAALLMSTDYSWYGVLLMWTLNFARRKKHRIVHTFMCLFLFIVPQSASLIPLFGYVDVIIIALALNSERLCQKCKSIGFEFLEKKPFKLMARYFYPVHMTLLGMCYIILTLI